jgi:hypothetical protein
MNTMISAVVSLFSMVMSMFGMGTSAYTQINQARALARPTPGLTEKYCPAPSVGQAQLMSDGSYQIQCVQEPQYSGNPNQ